MTAGMIGHQHRFVCIHIAKNASSTLREALGREAVGGEFKGRLPPPAELEDYFVFAFLRDPVERLLSAYQEISVAHEAGWRDQSKRHFAALPESMDRFATFVEDLGGRGWDVHIEPQSRIVAGIDVDFYGSVEHLERDLTRVYETLGLGELAPLTRRRSREGRAKDRGYSKHFLHSEDLDERLIRRIREIYADDIELCERVLTPRRRVRSWQPPVVRVERGSTGEAELPWLPWTLPRPPKRPKNHAPASLLQRVTEVSKPTTVSIDGLDANLVSQQTVRTRLARPRSTDPDHENWPWYPQLERAFILHLEDAFIGDNVVFDDAHYFGLGRHWLGRGWELYADTREVKELTAAVSIAAWGGEAFQLFVLAGLPKLGMVLDLLESPGFEEVKIVSHDAGAVGAPWFWNALGLRDRIVQKPINAKEGFVIHADRVYFPQYAPTLDSYGLYARNTLQPVRRRLGSLDPGEQDLIVYIDRPFPLIRSVGNREELLAALRKRLAGTRYRLEVWTSNGTDADRKVFERAKVILGPHGGGFANMIFARPGTHIVEFLPIYRLYRERKPCRPVFWGMAQGCGLDYWTTEPRGFDFIERNMQVDVPDILEILDRAITPGIRDIEPC